MTHDSAAISAKHHGSRVRRKQIERAVLAFCEEIDRGGDPAIHALRLKATVEKITGEGK